MDQPHLPEVPAGLPSSLLQRRADVRRSEENLVAANANVGVAKAAFFPQISLTGIFGAQSTAITSFLQGPATIWSLGGQALQPIFQGGRIRANYRLAWAQRDEAELVYKQTVLQAFGDVANSLVGYSQSRLYRMKIDEQTRTYAEMARLANVRFQGGVTSFLEVQYYEQQYFTSALNSDAGVVHRAAELRAVVPGAGRGLGTAVRWKGTASAVPQRRIKKICHPERRAQRGVEGPLLPQAIHDLLLRRAATSRDAAPIGALRLAAKPAARSG